MDLLDYILVKERLDELTEWYKSVGIVSGAITNKARNGKGGDKTLEETIDEAEQDVQSDVFNDLSVAKMRSVVRIESGRPYPLECAMVVEGDALRDVSKQRSDDG